MYKIAIDNIPDGWRAEDFFRVEKALTRQYTTRLGAQLALESEFYGAPLLGDSPRVWVEEVK